MTYIPYASVAAASSGVSDSASFPSIPREELIREIDRLGPSVVHAHCSCGGKLAGDATEPNLGDAIRYFGVHHRGCSRAAEPVVERGAVAVLGEDGDCG